MTIDAIWIDDWIWILDTTHNYTSLFTVTYYFPESYVQCRFLVAASNCGHCSSFTFPYYQRSQLRTSHSSNSQQLSASRPLINSLINTHPHWFLSFHLTNSQTKPSELAAIPNCRALSAAPVLDCSCCICVCGAVAYQRLLYSYFFLCRFLATVRNVIHSVNLRIQ
jgi:hypothetical protein